MNRQELIQQIRSKRSFLCVGLDPDLDKVPEHLRDSEQWMFDFCVAIVDATAAHCVAYKPNTAFFECYGAWGWQQFERVCGYIRQEYPHHFLIADAKRGDIGNTSTRYAKAFFKQVDCHAVTVVPYMGSDSIEPFLAFEDKWAIMLALTSNTGSQDLQHHGTPRLFEQVIKTSQGWRGSEKLMYVAGATRGSDLAAVRAAAGDAFLLVPGVGAQGGSLAEVVEHAMLPTDVGLLVNSSRAIIYAGAGLDFAEQSAVAAAELSGQMATYF